MFISYSRADFYFAEQLAAGLSRCGLLVWFDVHELLPGADWSEAIDTAIEACDTFVLVASRAALKSPYVARERDQANLHGRPCAVVLARRMSRARLPGPALYDLTTTFRRGVEALAIDARAGDLRGRRPRLRLPMPPAACVVALAPASGIALALVLGMLFVTKVVGHEAVGVSDADRATVLAIGFTGLLGALSVTALWSFSARRVTWISLRGSQLTLPLLAIVGVVVVDALARHITTDPLVAMLGGTSDNSYLGDAPTVLASAVVLTSVSAAVATAYASGVCRHLRTGVAPDRVRRRHTRGAERPVVEREPAHWFRVFAASHDSSVADEVRRALSEAAMLEAVDEQPSDVDVVVLSDRTPADWLACDTYRNPLAVVATSVAVPVTGMLQRFQWIDYRRRRRRTLTLLAQQLTSRGDAALSTTDIPERLQQMRLPLWITITQWTLISMATLAIIITAYPLEQRLFSVADADLWPGVLCVLIAIGLVVVAQRLRTRRVTPLGLVVAVAVAFVGMWACRLSTVVRALYPSSSPHSWMIYPTSAAAVLGFGWISLWRWLPIRHSGPTSAPLTLGSVGGPWPWRVAVVPLAVGLLSATGLDDPIDPASSSIDLSFQSPPEVCQDQAKLIVLLQPIVEASDVVGAATTVDTLESAIRARIAAVPGVIDDLEQLDESGNWGDQTSARLIAGLHGLTRADRAFLELPQGSNVLHAEYDEMDSAVAELDAPICLDPVE